MSIEVRVVKNGGIRRVTAEPGTLLSDLMGMGGHSFNLPCGGIGKCLRCRVRAEGAVSAPSAAEREAFAEEELEQGYRLACLARAEGDLTLCSAVEEVYDSIFTGGETPPFRRDPLYRSWGVAVDIGTTTVVAQLYGPDGLAQTVSLKNPQTAFGADVISRIEKALAGQGPALAAAIRYALVEMIKALVKKQGVGMEAVDAVVVTGNTTMLYLLAGQSPEPLSHAPFAADRLFGEFLPAKAFRPEFDVAETARIYLPRCMSAFVGGDITTAVLASGMCGQEETGLLCDIGTNGEIALWHEGRLYCCSTAAGPAFEGVGIRMGVYGVRGAIDKVWLEGGRVRTSTVGGAPPVGICGSGVVDALAVMLESGAIDETGALQNGEDEFHLGGGVVLTGRDVRQIQLAKGSVRAGLETLLEAAGVRKEQVKQLYIAGGFGNYLDLNSAAAIGLVPPELLPGAKTIGNAALTGAAMLLQNRAFLPETEALAASARAVALDANPVFMDHYMDYMMFGE